MFHLNFSVNLFLVVINFCLIITFTRKWSESHFGPRRVLTSCINFFFLLFTGTWSVWLSVKLSGDIQVPLCIFLCWKKVLATTISLTVAYSHTSSPFPLVVSCSALLLLRYIYTYIYIYIYIYTYIVCQLPMAPCHMRCTRRPKL